LTWDDDFIDNKKYFKLIYPSFSQHKQLYNFLPFEDKKYLSCMISWKKIYNNPNETQSIKNNIIDYFENNHFLDHFHLYGPNWNEKVFSYSSFFKFLNYPRFKLLRKFLLRYKLTTWKGISEDKQKTISNYKFLFIIENGMHYNGYLTDKIFECFYSGTVPIYLGALNIKSYIPEECYIDFRKFKNISDLHNYLLNIDHKTYKEYISNISNFLKNNNDSIFTFEYFNETLLNSIKSLVKNKF
jgi:alpha(1,3/1,4) fucosyltransferase